MVPTVMENGHAGKEAEPEEWFPTDESKKDLEQVKKGRDEFRQWVLSNVKDILSPPSTDKKAKTNGTAKSRSSLEDVFSNASYEDSIGFVESYSIINDLGAAARARSDLFMKRSKGARKVGREIEKFASTFREFLGVCKPIVDIAGSASPGYIGAAYETLNILFAVAAARQKTEMELTAQLEDMKERLPDLMVYQRIYKNADLGKKIAAVYKGIVCFSREATRYFVASHGIKRWGMAFGGSQSFYVPDSSFKKDMFAVRNKCEVLLSANVDKLKKMTEDQQKKIDKLLADTTQRRLLDFRGFLGQTPEQERTHEVSLRTYKEHLDGFITDERVEQLSTESLLSTPEIKAWIESPDSKLLILHGMNERSRVEDDDVSWLSPSAVGLIDHLTEQRHTVVHYLCAPSPWSRKQPLQQVVIASLAYQILQNEPEVLQVDAYTTLRHVIEGKNIEEDLDPETALDILTRILQLPRKKEKIFVLVDRIDRCNEEDGMRNIDFLKELAKVVGEARCTAKVIVVINNFYWHFENQLEKFKASVGNMDKVHHYQRDQEMHPDRW